MRLFLLILKYKVLLDLGGLVMKIMTINARALCKFFY